jgi:hypothetical protein
VAVFGESGANTGEEIALEEIARVKEEGTDSDGGGRLRSENNGADLSLADN